MVYLGTEQIFYRYYEGIKFENTSKHFMKEWSRDSGLPHQVKVIL